MNATPIDEAHEALSAAPDEETLKLRFLDLVMSSELFLLLAEEPLGERVTPRLFDLEDGRFAVAFDSGGRLAEFVDAPEPYVALTGRRLVEMLTGQGVGIALNPMVAPSETMLTAEELDWLAAMAGGGPELSEVLAESIASPCGVPDALMEALGARLATLSPVMAAAWLVEAIVDGGEKGLLLALVDVPQPAHEDVASAVAEVVRFSPAGVAGVDLTFLEGNAPELRRIERVGVRFDRTLGQTEERSAPEGPGMDPLRPPVLR